MFFELTK